MENFSQPNQLPKFPNSSLTFSKSLIILGFSLNLAYGNLFSKSFNLFFPSFPVPERTLLQETLHITICIQAINILAGNGLIISVTLIKTQQYIKIEKSLYYLTSSTEPLSYETYCEIPCLVGYELLVEHAH